MGNVQSLKRELVEHLIIMRQKFGAVETKAEFESMGIRLSELDELVRLANSADLGVMLKIGGPEDKWGIEQAIEAGARGIVAPMVESPFGLFKFLEAVKPMIDGNNKPLIAVNVETILACHEFPNMLTVAQSEEFRGVLDAITIGRVDLSGSMHFDPELPSLAPGRERINESEVYTQAFTVCRAAKDAGLMVTLGGGIENASENFISRLVHNGVLDRFETRMVVFDAATAMKNYEEAVVAAHKVELLWLRIKRAYYDRRVHEDDGRLAMLAKRTGVGE